jgi:hypothetical protein
MSEQSNIKLTLEGGGLSYAGSVTLRQAAEIVRVASLKPEDLLVKSSPSTPSNPPSDKASVSELSLPEAINAAKPGNSPETITVIATWIMDTEGADSVSRADVASRYRDARLPPPGNMPRDFSQAVRKGLLAPVRGNSNQFYVTQTGRALLANKEKS